MLLSTPFSSIVLLFFFINITTIIVTLTIHQSLSVLDGNHDNEDLVKLSNETLEGRDEDQAKLKLSNETLEERHRIPRRIIIMDRVSELSKIKSPRLENTYNTIREYHNAWFHSNQNLTKSETNKLTEEQLQIVTYLNNKSCIEILKQTEPRLVPHFDDEIYGKYKADICRIAELYMRGGYYFDTDMKVVKPLLLPPHVTFTAPFEADAGARSKSGLAERNNKGIFNSFIASAPNHPILRHALDLILQKYEGKLKIRFESQLGPASLFNAYKQFEESSIDLKQQWPIDMTLAETYLNNQYPTFPRLLGKGYACHYVVHNFTEMEIYFYSRIPGVGELCSLT